MVADITYELSEIAALREKVEIVQGKTKRYRVR